MLMIDVRGGNTCYQPFISGRFYGRRRLRVLKRVRYPHNFFKNGVRDKNHRLLRFIRNGGWVSLSRFDYDLPF